MTPNAPASTVQAWPSLPAAPQASGMPPAAENGPPVPNRLRPVPIGKTVLLGIVTIGIYFWMRSFKLSGDLHRMPGGNPNWQLFFWLGFIPWVGIVFTLILYFQNNKQANALSQQRGIVPTYTPFILACIPLVWLAAPFVWASQYNALASRT